MNATTYIETLQEHGRSTFSFEEAMKIVGGSESAVRLALARLKKNSRIVSVYPKFYSILPPEYRSAGSPPAYDFIPGLMAYIKKPYYVGLLSAGEYHGSAHHRPQVFQVMVEGALRRIKCGEVAVDFHVRSKLKRLPVVKKNTKWGYINVATAETTAIDLIGYSKQSAGLDNVTNILAEMLEDNLLQPKAILKVAKLSPPTWGQRLGYLLDFLGADNITVPLADWIEKSDVRVTPLAPGISITGVERDTKWQVAKNVSIEVDV